MKVKYQLVLTNYDIGNGGCMNSDLIPILVHVVAKGHNDSRYQCASHPRVLCINRNLTLIDLYRQVKQLTK